MSKAPLNARIDAKAMSALKSEAKERQQTVTQLLEQIITQHQSIESPDAERKMAALEATINEQDRLLRKRTGKGTPAKRRITLTISHEAAQRIDKEAAAAGMSRSELIDYLATQPKRIYVKRTLPATLAVV